MKDPSDHWEELRRKVLGLGDTSLRKTHYPSLRQRLVELERLRADSSRARRSFDSSSMRFLNMSSSWSRMGALFM